MILWEDNFNDGDISDWYVWYGNVSLDVNRLKVTYNALHDFLPVIPRQPISLSFDYIPISTDIWFNIDFGGDYADGVFGLIMLPERTYIFEADYIHDLRIYLYENLLNENHHFELIYTPRIDLKLYVDTILKLTLNLSISDLNFDFSNIYIYSNDIVLIDNFLLESAKIQCITKRDEGIYSKPKYCYVGEGIFTKK